MVDVAGSSLLADSQLKCLVSGTQSASLNKAVVDRRLRPQCCLLRATPKAACEPHCLSLAATSTVEQPQLMCKYGVVHKPEIRNVSLRPRGGPSHGHS